MQPREDNTPWDFREPLCPGAAACFPSNERVRPPVYPTKEYLREASPHPRRVAAIVQAMKREAARSPDLFKDGGPATDLPTYNLERWMSRYPTAWPSTPAVFSASLETAWAPFFEHFPTPAAFLASRFAASYQVYSMPSIAQIGGHLSSIGAFRVGFRWSSLQDLARRWTSDENLYVGQYVSEFGRCHMQMCKQLVVDEVGLPKYFGRRPLGTNFQVGGPGSGLAFHQHAATWQLQLAGRKVWYFVPPGRMTGALAERVGPLLYPPSAWAESVRGLPLGERPMRCVQHPGGACNIRIRTSTPGMRYIH